MEDPMAPLADREAEARKKLLIAQEVEDSDDDEPATLERVLTTNQQRWKGFWSSAQRKGSWQKIEQ